MKQLIDWWKTLPLKGKLYSLIPLVILFAIIFSKNNVYKYSDTIIISGVMLGLLIIVDTARCALKTKANNTNAFLIKRLLGSLVITSFGVWSFFLLVELSMDAFNNNNKELEAYFVSRHSTNLRAGQSKICSWYGVATDKSGESHRFCVGHIEDHQQLESLENSEVILVGRESWAGFVVDGIKRNNEIKL